MAILSFPNPLYKNKLSTSGFRKSQKKVTLIVHDIRVMTTGLVLSSMSKRLLLVGIVETAYNKTPPNVSDYLFGTHIFFLQYTFKRRSLMKTKHLSKYQDLSTVYFKECML